MTSIRPPTNWTDNFFPSNYNTQWQFVVGKMLHVHLVTIQTQYPVQILLITKQVHSGFYSGHETTCSIDIYTLF